MKKNILTVLGIVMLLGCMTGCGKTAEEASAPATEPATETEASTEESTNELVTYEFETYDGENVVIDSSNIVSQESDENPLESAKVPADAEVVAPGRDYVYLADANYYYVEDAVNNLVTVANKGAAAAETDTAALADEVYTCDDYSISYLPKEFSVSDVRGMIQLLYISEDVVDQGANEILITKEEGMTAEELANAIAGEDADQVSDGVFGAQEIPVKVYSRTSEAPVEGADLTLVDSFVVMDKGDAAISIEIIRTIGQGDEIDMTIEGAFTHTLESFVLN